VRNKNHIFRELGTFQGSTVRFLCIRFGEMYREYALDFPEQITASLLLYGFKRISYPEWTDEKISIWTYCTKLEKFHQVIVLFEQ